MSLSFDFSLTSSSYTPPAGNNVNFQFNNTMIYSYGGSGQITASNSASLKLEKKYTGTGTINSSGQASNRVSNSYSTSGQITISGSATTGYGTYYTASGQIITSNSASESLTKKYVASGQLQTTNSATLTVTKKYIGSGTLHISGQATTRTNNIYYTGSGTLNVSGASTYSINNRYYTGSGILNTGGIATYSVNNRYYTGSGSLTVSGSAIHSINNHYYTGNGTINYSGYATYSINNRYYTGSGSLSSTGSAGVIFNDVIQYSGSGTISMSGASNIVFINSSQYTGGGTINIAGVSQIKVQYSYATFGGINASSSASTSFLDTFEYSATGSITASGSATCSFQSVDNIYYGGGLIQSSGSATECVIKTHLADGFITVSNNAVCNFVHTHMSQGTVYVANSAIEKVNYKPSTIMQQINVGGTYKVKRIYSPTSTGNTNISGSAIVNFDGTINIIAFVDGITINDVVGSVNVIADQVAQISTQHTYVTMFRGNVIETLVNYVYVEITSNDDNIGDDDGGNQNTTNELTVASQDDINEKQKKYELFMSGGSSEENGSNLEKLAPLIPVGLAASFFIGTDKEEESCKEFKSPSDIFGFLPSFDEIHDAFVAAFKIPLDALNALKLKFPPKELMIHFPTLPSFPDFDFSFGDIEIPSMASAYAALSTYATQAMAVLKTIADNIFKFIGNIPFPKLPKLDFDIFDFFSLDPKALMKKIRDKIPDLKDIWDDLGFPEIFNGIGSKALELATALVMGMVHYVGMLIDFVVSLIKKFLDYLDKLEIDFPDMPDFPSLSEIYANLKEKLTSEGDNFFDDVKNGIKNNTRQLVDQFDKMHIPDVTIPDPVFPKIDMPSVELVYKFGATIAQMFGAVIKKIKEYIDKLPLLSDIIKWPQIKDWFKSLSIPQICVLGLKDGIEKESESQSLFDNQNSPINNNDQLFENLKT